MVVPEQLRTCQECDAHFEVEFFGSPLDNPRINHCPHCGSENIHRVDQ